MTFHLKLREERPATIQEHRALRDEIARLQALVSQGIDIERRLRTREKRLQAAFAELQKLFGHIEGINDERDSVPILLEARRIVEEVSNG